MGHDQRAIISLPVLHFSVMKALACLLLAAPTLVLASFAANTDYDALRRRMVEEQIAARDIADARVLDAMRKIPRHEFVAEAMRPAAYDDGPLPIGHGQTISQPYIVALMTDLLRLKKSDKALEVGTGSGYQAALLGELVSQVYTIEIIEPLAQSAAARLKQLGYKNVEVRFGDGYHGWAEHAPFDAIIVTAASDHVPPPLVRQLKPGGRMVIPLGSTIHRQMLVLLEKDANGRLQSRNVAPVVFVPFTRAAKK